MGAITNGPECVVFVTRSALILNHILTCHGCQTLADADELDGIDDIFDGLNELSDSHIATHDYLAALVFCHTWMDKRGIGPTRH